MCADPITLATIGSAVISSVGALKQGQNQAAQMRAQAAQADQQADYTRIQAGYEANQRSEQLRQLTGQQITGSASDGGDLSGSTLDLIGNSRREGNMDKAAIEYGAAVKANGLHDEADAYDSAARSARTSSYLSALAPIVSLAGNSNVVKLGQSAFSSGTPGMGSGADWYKVTG